jgi:hypothetical protein
MKISYGVTVCDELEEIQRLIDFLLKNKCEEDEIVILVDISKENNGKLRGWLNETKQHLILKGDPIKIHEDKFIGHFADWKNKLNSYCNGDYIFSIDADEIPSEDLIKGLPFILEQNPNTEMYLVPRINTVEGITQEHLDKWKWIQNEKGWIQYPDFQMRVYKNTPEIKWKNKVHEILDGFKSWSAFPTEDEEFVLYHPKTIERQEKQNNFYNTL